MYRQNLSSSKHGWLYPRLVKLNPLNFSSYFPLPPFLWDWAAPRRTSADLEEGKRAKSGKRRITLAGKKALQRQIKCRDWV